MKTCFKCAQQKPLTEFYAHKKMGDGHLNKCKECAKIDVRKHREANAEKVRAYDRIRSSLPHRKDLQSKNIKAYRSAHRERARANSKVAHAVRLGTVKKLPCFVCGDLKVEGHHPAYSLPLDVVWLCPAHHREIHLKKETY